MYRSRLLCFVLCLVGFVGGLIAQEPQDSIDVINAEKLDDWLTQYSIKDSVDQSPVDTSNAELKPQTKSQSQDSIDNSIDSLSTPSISDSLIDTSVRSSRSLVNYDDYIKLLSKSTRLEELTVRLRQDSIALVGRLNNKSIQMDSLCLDFKDLQMSEKNLRDSLMWVTYKKQRWGNAFDSLVNNRFFNQAIAPKCLITSADSLTFRRQSLASSDKNTLFLDWVFASSTDSVAPLKDADLCIWNIRQEVRQALVRQDVSVFKYHRDELPSFKDIHPSTLMDLKRENIKLKVGNNSKFEETTVRVRNYRNRWRYGGLVQLHTSQNYISSNWYKGGESNLNFNARIKYELNYTNFKNIQWDNCIEYKQNLMSAGSDTLRSMRLNEDQLSVQSKFSRKAFKKFYYTVEMNLTSPLFNMYEANSMIRTAAFAAPVRSYWSLGVDYKKGDNFSVFVSPLSYKVVYINDTTVAKGVSPDNSLARKYSMDPGTKSSHQLGCLARVSYKHKLMQNVHLEHKFYSYINYVGGKKGVEFDYEMLASFQINQFLTAELVLHPRYDTLIEIPEGKSAFQFKEVISLGFCSRF